MIDRAAVEAYDRFVASVAPCDLETTDVRVGFWHKARIVRPSDTDPPHDEEFDVVVAGGGPTGLLYASILAKRGHSVLLLEARDRLFCGATWNLSHEEFDDLRKTNALTAAQWSDVVAGDFNEGVFRLFDSKSGRHRQYRFDHILNISIEHEKFFEYLSEAPGLQIRLACRARLACITRNAACISCDGPGGNQTFKARLFIDARGWTSPLAALVHPQRQVESVYNILGVHTKSSLPRPTSPTSGRPLGIICATFEDEIDTGEGVVQPILERFTDYVEGRVDGGDVLYYFTRTPRPTPIAPLIDDMLVRIDAVIPGFRESLVDRTYFGHGPGYYPPRPFSRRGIQTSAGDRILLAGVAARQYNGLTGCGFGPIARNAADICDAVDAALRDDDLSFRRLQKIDIDRRERISQHIGELFGGAMMLAEHETRGTCNRDWIAFMEAGARVDPDLKNEAFRDKIRLKTLNQLIHACSGNPGVVRALLRNNRGRIGTVIWTFLSSYIKLYLIENSLLVKRREAKYLAGSSGALLRLPFYLAANGRMLVAGRRALRYRQTQPLFMKQQETGDG